MGIISRLEFSKSLSFHCDFLRIGRIPAKSANSGLSSLKNIFTLLGPVFLILFIFFQRPLYRQCPIVPNVSYDQMTSSIVTGELSLNFASFLSLNSTHSRFGPVSIDSAKSP